MVLIPIPQWHIQTLTRQMVNVRCLTIYSRYTPWRPIYLSRSTHLNIHDPQSSYSIYKHSLGHRPAIREYPRWYSRITIPLLPYIPIYLTTSRFRINNPSFRLYIQKRHKWSTRIRGPHHYGTKQLHVTITTTFTHHTCCYLHPRPQLLPGQIRLAPWFLSFVTTPNIPTMDGYPFT